MTANGVLDIARKELGTTENPRGSNNVKYNTWYYGREVRDSGAARYPWCMAFVQWVMDKAGIKPPIRTASCGTLMRAAKKAGSWVTGGYQPGDVLIYDFPGGSGTDHTGICESATETAVTAIEGNTSVSNASNGGQVCRMTRKIGLVVGAWRPEYDKEGMEMDIDKLINEMTDKQAVRLFDRVNQAMSREPLPANWDAKGALQKAVDAGVTDGSNPMGLPLRYQVAIMAERAGRGK